MAYNICLWALALAVLLPSNVYCQKPTVNELLGLPPPFNLDDWDKTAVSLDPPAPPAAAPAPAPALPPDCSPAPPNGVLTCATPSPSDATINQVKAVLRASAYNVSNFQPTTINVFWHIITSNVSNLGDVSQSVLDTQLAVFNAEFNRIGFFFRTAGVDRTVNRTWYTNMVSTIPPGTSELPNKDFREWEMKRALHKGGLADLNIYTLRLKLASGATTFPWEATDEPALDGIMLRHDMLKGNPNMIPNYEYGFAPVHEVCSMQPDYEYVSCPAKLCCICPIHCVLVASLPAPCACHASCRVLCASPAAAV